MPARIARALAHEHAGRTAAESLACLVGQGLDELPWPAAGDTLLRWQALAQVASHDLSLAKLYEGHTDALAILHELGGRHGQAPRGATWGVWASEAPGARVLLQHASDGSVLLEGRKNWCSGAATSSHALLTAWEVDATSPQLVSIALEQPGIEVLQDGWQAVGMAGSASLDVRFRAVRGELVGRPGAYLSRPGFWQGGAGVAACWYGGAQTLAEALRQGVVGAGPAASGVLRLVALGGADLALQACAATLREAAEWLDGHPKQDASEVALRARLLAEQAATRVLETVGRALGAAPFCRDARFARLAADLPVFVRQSHAERDLAALGERLASPQAGTPWRL